MQPPMGIVFVVVIVITTLGGAVFTLRYAPRRLLAAAAVSVAAGIVVMEAMPAVLQGPLSGPNPATLFVALIFWPIYGLPIGAWWRKRRLDKAALNEAMFGAPAPAPGDSPHQSWRR